MKGLFPILFLVIFPFFVHSKVIVTHGVAGEGSSWYKAGGYFYEALKESATVLEQDVISFSWEQDLGGITHKERFKAGKELAKLIIDLVGDGEKEIVIIGHSYGGHVIKVASQILAVSLGLQDINRPIMVRENNKAVSALEIVFFKEICEELKEYLSKKLLKEKRDFLINAAYTLGTPNDIPDYFASMDVIESFFNFYSDGDLVQDLVGDKLLPEPRHERAVNLSIRINGTGWFGLWGKPNHEQIHAQIIAKWILFIPFFLMEEKVGNFDKFNFEYDGQIRFTENNPPVYFCNKAGFNEDGFFAKYDLEWVKNRFSFLRNLC